MRYMNTTQPYDIIKTYPNRWISFVKRKGFGTTSTGDSGCGEFNIWIPRNMKLCGINPELKTIGIRKCCIVSRLCCLMIHILRNNSPERNPESKWFYLRKLRTVICVHFYPLMTKDVSLVTWKFHTIRKFGMSFNIDFLSKNWSGNSGANIPYTILRYLQISRRKSYYSRTIKVSRELLNISMHQT